VNSGAPALRKLVRKGVGWTTLNVVIGRFGQLIQGVVVARIVAPREFGVFATALVVHAVVVNVSELGVSAGLIRDDPAHTARSAPTVATIAVVNSLLLAAAMAALSSTLAQALGSPGAAALIAVMALTLPLAGLTSVPVAILTRDFRMERIFVANIANMLVSGIVVVFLALAGWGALALAWSWVAGQLVTTLVLLTARSACYLPGWSTAQARRLLSFGLPLAGANVLAFLVLNIDYVIVGRRLGPEALGFYLLAFNVSGWPLNVFGTVIRSVSLPGFARLGHDGEFVPEHFVRALRLVAGVALPVCLILAVLGGPAIELLYGRRWLPGEAPLVGLCVLGASRILLELSGDFLVSTGRTRALMIAQVPWLVVLGIALWYVAPRAGLGGIGATQAVVAVALMWPIYAVLLRRSGVNLGAALRALSSPLAWSLLAAGGAYGASSLGGTPLTALVAGGLAGLGTISEAIRSRAVSTAASATHPNGWLRLAELPNFSTK